MMDERNQIAVAVAVEVPATLSQRMSRAAQSLTRMVARLATEDDPTKVVFSIAKYINAGLPEAETVKDVAAMIEGARSPEWQEKRAKSRQRSQSQRLEWQLSHGSVNEHDKTLGGVSA